MASLDDLTIKYRLLVRAYPWRRVDPVPCATLSRPLSDCRVALVTSAGLTPPGAPAFDDQVRGGDCSYRTIPDTVDVQSLGESHRSEAFDHQGIERDRNLALPLDRLRELAAAGVIGEVAPRHASFMGSITAPGRLTGETAPEVAGMLVKDGVDAAALIPV